MTTKDRQKVMWARIRDPLPRGICAWENSTSRDRPITISGIRMGRYTRPLMTLCILNLYRCRAMAAMVPRVVDTMVEAKPMIRVLIRASSTRRLLNSCSYHLKVKPAQTALMRESLKEYMARMMRGTYRNARMARE